MPESEAKSHHVNNGKAVQSINPPQSAWLTHWAGTKSESSTHDHLTRFSRSKGDDHDIKKHLSGVEIASDNFGSPKGVRDVDLAMSLKKPSSQSFPFFKLGQESGKSSIPNEKEETRGAQAPGPQVFHKELATALNVETSSRNSHVQPESVSKIPTEQVKYHMFFGESSYSCSRPSKEKFTGPVSHISMDPGMYKLDSRTTNGPENFRQLTAAFASTEHLPKPNLASTQQEHPSYCSHSAALVSNRDLNNFLKHGKSEMPSFLRQKNAAVLMTDPSTSINHSPTFIEDQYKRMQNHIGMTFLHDVQMRKTCAPLGSVEGLAGGLHSFSRTTHSLLITKQTDVKVYQDNQIFRESMASAQLKGEALGELNCSPPHFAHGQSGVKLQLLDSSDHESQENGEDVRAGVQANESSADTDTMDMELFKENHLSGANLTPRNKDIMVESNLPFRPSIALSTEKDTRRKRKIELPDMNLDLSTDKAEPCPSRTQSLDMNTLQFNINHTSNSKSDECSDSNMGSELGSRWIKRLKLNASSSLFHGTKSSKFPEPSIRGKCHQKGSEIPKGECSVKEQRTSAPSVYGKDITLSHSWIRRWSHNQGQKTPATVETSKPENSKEAAEEFQKKPFPSIAAMALMGKAMTGYQQCKFQKKESFIIWNTKAFD